MGNGSDVPHDNFDPRVTLHNARTGETSPVSADSVLGLDEFAENWEHNTNLPHELSFSAWQMSDEDHPPGTGKAGYRVVHKMLRTAVVPSVNISFPNMRVTLSNQAITLGEPRFPGAIAGRTEGTYLVPEWGEVKLNGETSAYRYAINNHLEISAHQETTPVGNFLEILYQLPEQNDNAHDEALAAGRAGVWTLTMILDLVYGERIIGPIVTEEVREVFDDWHWNRRLGGRTLSMESQARLDIVPGDRYLMQINPIISRYIELSDAERNRIRVAAHWYWRAERDSDRVQRYIGYWLCIEALELGQNSNIAPLKKTLADLLKVDRGVVSPVVGRIYATRNALVHGEVTQVDKVSLERVRALAVAVLERHCLTEVSAFTVAGLRWAFALGEWADRVD